MYTQRRSDLFSQETMGVTHVIVLINEKREGEEKERDS
jgi:hypothetical protein